MQGGYQRFHPESHGNCTKSRSRMSRMCSLHRAASKISRFPFDAKEKKEFPWIYGLNFRMQGTPIPWASDGYPMNSCRLLLKYVLTEKVHILEYILVIIQLYYRALRGIFRMNLLWQSAYGYRAAPTHCIGICAALVDTYLKSYSSKHRCFPPSS